MHTLCFTLFCTVLVCCAPIAAQAPTSPIAPAAAPTAPIASASATAPLTREQASAAIASAWKQWAERERPARQEELKSGTVRAAGAAMRIWSKTFGAKPEAGRALYISMHGGGSAPAAVNEQQWENQKRLYEPAEGIYVAPRAHTDAWNMWHQAPCDALFARLIQDMVLCQEVDPNRVYLMGYSAGGDGVYQLAPRMADYWAAAAMMAGHPNETRPDSLRNIGFALHMGADDSAFERNKVAAKWGEELAALAAADAGAYRHVVKLHAGLGHWMQRKDAVAVPWMSTFRREMRPTKVVWLQDDVLHQSFYWLGTNEPVVGARCVVRRDAQAFTIEDHTGLKDLHLLLDDRMCDLDKPVSVCVAGKIVFEGLVPRSLAVINKTLEERGDLEAIFCAQLTVPLTAAAAPTQPR